MAHKARKRFGQNFLHDDRVIQQIITHIQPEVGQVIIEIGPGQGAITYPLLQHCKKMMAIELDRDLVQPLQLNAKRHGELSVLQQDALTVDFNQLAAAQRTLRVIGNLPYNISTPLLFHLFQFMSVIIDMHVMLQKEVVQRMAAEPGSGTYGRLSVMVQYYCQVIPLFDINPDSFSPKPNVDSTFVRLIPHSSPPVDIKSIVSLQKVVSQAFSQRRKTLGNTLKSIVSREQIQALGIDPGLRAERLALADFAKLTYVIGDES